jgi:GT2 family glycosyltransferase
MLLSYIIVTHNRRAALLKTLAILQRRTPLARDQWETWVVDNASTDGSCQAVANAHPEVRLIRNPSNEGVGARSRAFDRAAGRYVVLLDDDSYPVGDAVLRSIDYLERTPGTGAVVGRVLLPDGSEEACAMPGVMLSGAVCLRKAVLDEVGGFAPEFFRKAGEYDISYRLWRAGYAVQRFEDIVYRHDKVMTGRSSALAHRMDLRNNLILVERYLPRSLRRAYRKDWLQRYAALARHADQAQAVSQAVAEARDWAQREREAGRSTLLPGVIETLFELETQRQAIDRWALAHRAERVVIADFGKNLYATWTACESLGLDVVAIADNHPAYAGLRYRGIPIVSDAYAATTDHDGIILANLNPAQAPARATQLRAAYRTEPLTLYQSHRLTAVKPLVEAA